MKKVSTIIAFVLCSFFIASTANAQLNVGHVNSLEIFEKLPARKQADANFQSFGQQLQKQFEAKAQQLSQKGQGIQAQIDRGELSQIQIQEKQREIQAESQQLQQLEVSMTEKLQARRIEIYQPVNNQVQAAIDKVAKEKGYTYVFDIASGNILYFNESKDITSLVLTALGI